MNKTSLLKSSARTAAVLSALAALSATSAHAQLYWDTNGTTSGTGGDGVWDTSTINWNSSSAGTGTASAWDNALNQATIADFRGTGGAVTVDAGGVRAGGLSFNAGAYTFSGGPITLTTVNLINATGTSGNITVGSDLRVDSSTFTGAQSLVIQSSVASTLTLNGDLRFDYTGGVPSGAKTISLRGNNAASVMVLNGDIVAPVGGTATASLQLFGASGARYEINGDNTGLTASQSGQIVRGTAVLGHARAFNTGTIQLGISSTTATDTAAILTSGALTIANNVSVGGANASSQLIVGGDSAHVSTYSGTFNAGSGAQNLRFSAVSGGRVNFSNSISGSGTGQIIKQGEGVVAFTRAAGNTYSRGTFVNEGTLLAGNTSGSATGSGTVTVASGATLGGTGFITGPVVASAAGSVFSAGDMSQSGVSSIGTLTMSGGFTATSGATFNFDVNGASVDTINFGAGPVDIDGTLTVNFTSLGTVQTGTTYSLFAGSGDWTSVSATFAINAPTGYVLDSSFGGGLGYVFDAANHTFNVQFSTAAVPEPSTFAVLGGVVALGFAALRRRRAVRA